MRKITGYFKSISSEMKKVSWMNKEQILSSTLIVLFFAAIIATFLYILDRGLVKIIELFTT